MEKVDERKLGEKEQEIVSHSASSVFVSTWLSMGHTCAYTHALCIVGASLNLDLVKIQLLCIQESPWGKWSKKVIGEITVELACYGVQVHLILGNILSHIISQGPMEAQTQCGADSNTCLDFSKSKLLMELW